MNTSNNLSSYSRYVKFTLMTPKSYKKLRGSTMGYKYTPGIETTIALENATTRGLHLAGKITNKTFNISQWLPLK